MRKYLLLLLVLAVIIILAGMIGLKKDSSSPGALQSHQGTILVKIKSAVLETELADTPEKRQRGLSGHAPLAENQAMLFIFEKPDFYSFWMKDMAFPIDIIWLDGGFSVVGLAQNISPKSFPKTFLPDSPAMYVLEIQAGLADKLGLVIGDKAELSNILGK